MGAALFSSATFSNVYAGNAANNEAPTQALKITHITLPLTAPNGMKIKELSALAWDENEKLLYALSDKGKVFQFDFSMKKDEASKIEIKYAADLSNDGKTLGLNAEGLALLHGNTGRAGGTELVVVGEGNHYFNHFTSQGVLKQKFPVPAPLDNLANYMYAHRGLEAVGMHPQHGALTAPESPLKNAPIDMHTIYGAQRTWLFPRYSKKSRLKEMAVLPNGNLVVLERTRDYDTMLFIASLRYVDLNSCSVNAICKVENKAILPASSDNYEGLAYLGDNHFLLVSDNGKQKENSTLVLLSLQ